MHTDFDVPGQYLSRKDSVWRQASNITKQGSVPKCTFWNPVLCVFHEKEKLLLFTNNSCVSFVSLPIVQHPALAHKTPARSVPGASTWVPVCTLSSFSSDTLASSPWLMLNTGAVIPPSPSSPSQMGRSSGSEWVMSRIFLEFLAAAAAADAPHCCRSAWHRRTSENWDQSSALLILAGCGKSNPSISICKSTSDHLLEAIPAKRNYNANSRTIEGDKRAHSNATSTNPVEKYRKLQTAKRRGTHSFESTTKTQNLNKWGTENGNFRRMRNNKRKNLSGWNKPTKQESHWMRNKRLVAE